MTQDVLVGLRFELSGGLGKMSGDIVGRVGELYLVQREGADHLELIELADLRSARFFARTRAQQASGPTVTSLKQTQSAPSARAATAEAPGAGVEVAGSRVSDNIRRSSSALDVKPER